MKNLFISILLFNFLSCIGQNKNEIDSNLVKTISSYFKGTPIYYTRTCSLPFDIKGFSIDTILVSSLNISDTLYLTGNEIKYILNELNKKVSWSDKMFKNSIMLDNNAAFIKDIFKKNSAFGASLDKMTYIYSFSKPIYLRGNLCVIYVRGLCGTLCGWDGLSIFKFENDKWINTYRIFSGTY